MVARMASSLTASPRKGSVKGTAFGGGWLPDFALMDHEWMKGTRRDDRLESLEPCAQGISSSYGVWATGSFFRLLSDDDVLSDELLALSLMLT